MATALDPTGRAVRIGRITIRSRGLRGDAEVHAPTPGGLRARALTTEALEAALSSTGFEPQAMVEISDAREVAGPTAGLRATAYDEPGLVVEVPEPGDGLGQVVLYSDEAGVTTWHLPEAEEAAGDAMRGGATRTYVLPRRPAPAPDAPGMRGLLGTIGKKLVTVLVFPLVDKVLGEVGDFFVSRWEAKHRPPGLRGFVPGEHTRPGAAPLDDATWQRLAEGPALLFVHGTFSTAHGAFGGLPAADLAELHRRYDGRVLAFDHPTVSPSPTENAAWLVGAMPEGLALELDVVCHSRGGLVARVLAEKQAELPLEGRRIDVRRVVFVGTPNAGTALAAPDHMGAMLDSVTNLIEFFPDNGVTDALEVVLTVLKQVAVGALEGLDGLTAMTPGGAYLGGFLNTGPAVPSRYMAVASNYEPVQPGLKEFAKDHLMDHVFGQKQNDLVVPTRGVFEAEGAGAFPITERLVLGDSEGVAHSGYFAHAEVRKKLGEWLVG